MHNILFRVGALIDMSHFVRRSQTRTQSLFKCFFGVREDWGLGWGAREVSLPSHKTPRAPQPNPQSSLTPKKHLNSDWVRVCVAASDTKAEPVVK